MFLSHLAVPVQDSNREFLIKNVYLSFVSGGMASTLKEAAWYLQTFSFKLVEEKRLTLLIFVDNFGLLMDK